PVCPGHEEPVMPVSAADFLDALQSSGVLEPDQVSQLDALRKQFPELKAFVQELIRRGWLTAFQANQFAAGKGASLVLDQYLLLQLLGEGGMGAVYKARQRRVKRDVALKLIRREAFHSPSAVARFRREAEIIARLSHPNIVTLFDANEVN